jgi:hypothetical protein
MSNITANPERVGRLTSSEIYRLCSNGRKKDEPGAPFYSYIEEKRAERSLGRSIDLGAVTNSLTWGKVMEFYCNKFHLDISYTLCSNVTDVHPKFKFWSGSKDATKSDTAVEIKCFEPKKFYELSMAIMQVNENVIDLEVFKKEFKEVYWQVVSNAIILNKPFCEIIVYTPTEIQLMQIREEIESTNVLEKLGIEPWQGRFIIEKEIYHLPFIPEGIEYPNFVKLRFEVSTEDIIFLTKCVTDAEKLLTNG